MFGGVNMHEYALGTSGFNHHFGPSRNPHHHSLAFTGGSSSGSAALVAAGAVPLAIGIGHPLFFAISIKISF